MRKTRRRPRPGLSAGSPPSPYAQGATRGGGRSEGSYWGAASGGKALRGELQGRGERRRDAAAIEDEIGLEGRERELVGRAADHPDAPAPQVPGETAVGE